MVPGVSVSTADPDSHNFGLPFFPFPLLLKKERGKKEEKEREHERKDERKDKIMKENS